MKVGLIIYGALDTVSGGYLYDRKLVAHLRACGDEVTVLSWPWQGYGRHLAHNVSRRLWHTLVAADFDVLLQDELNHPSLFWLNRWLKRRAAYPIVSIVHHLRLCEAHPRWPMALYRRVERAYLHSVAGFVFNSQTTRQEVEKLVGSRPCTVAYPGGDRWPPLMTNAAIIRRAHEPGPLRLLFVGNLIPRKGLHTLIDALCQLPSTDWRLEVVGNTAVSPAYTRHIQVRLPAQVTLHGMLPDEALAAWLCHSHLLVVPSHYEGFGIVYLEGMGFGLPAVGAAGGAAREIITEGKDGYIVDGADAAVLAQTIHRLHQAREQLACMGLAARQRFLRHPTWEESMATVRMFLQEITPAASG